MYTLGEAPRTSNEAYDTLETVFSASEFSTSEAVNALVEVLNISEETARNELNTLFRIGAVVEAQ